MAELGPKRFVIRREESMIIACGLRYIRNVALSGRNVPPMSSRMARIGKRTSANTLALKLRRKVPGCLASVRIVWITTGRKLPNHRGCFKLLERHCTLTIYSRMSSKGQAASMSILSCTRSHDDPLEGVKV